MEWKINNFTRKWTKWWCVFLEIRANEFLPRIGKQWHTMCGRGVFVSSLRLCYLSRNVCFSAIVSFFYLPKLIIISISVNSIISKATKLVSRTKIQIFTVIVWKFQPLQCSLCTSVPDFQSAGSLNHHYLQLRLLISIIIFISITLFI